MKLGSIGSGRIPDIERYRNNLRDELDGAALYEGLAATEPDSLRGDLFLQLAQAEKGHAQLWRDKLSQAGVQDERFAPAFRTRLLTKLSKRFGTRFVLPTIAAAEYADRDKYASQSDAHAISAEERGHAAVIRAVASSTGSRGGTVGRDIARAEPWHRAASGNNGQWAIGTSVFASGALLCAVGMLSSLFNGRSAWYSALRQLLFGCLAAAVTYGLGTALGTALS
jgi:hypothetical protein